MCLRFTSILAAVLFAVAAAATQSPTSAATPSAGAEYILYRRYRGGSCQTELQSGRFMKCSNALQYGGVWETRECNKVSGSYTGYTVTYWKDEQCTEKASEDLVRFGQTNPWFVLYSNFGRCDKDDVQAAKPGGYSIRLACGTTQSDAEEKKAEEKKAEGSSFAPRTSSVTVATVLAALVCWVAFFV